MKKEIKINRKENKIEIDGNKYPPTQYNLEIWRKYQRTKDEQVLDKLSRVVLDV